MKVIFIKFLVLFFAFSCKQKIYVSHEGNDSNPGTRSKPVYSFERAQLLARKIAGKKAVQVVFAKGTYYLSETIRFTNKDSGSENARITYKAEERGEVVLSGGRLLKLYWEPYENGIYKAAVPENVVIDQLYINGKRQRMARFPNAETGKNVFDTWDLIHTKTPDQENDPLTAERIARWKDPKGGYIHAMHASLWGDMHWIINGKKADGSLDYEGGWQNNRPSPMHPRYRMVENIFEELDAPGEWYYDSREQTLYYFPQPDVDLNNAVIEVVRLKHLIEFNGSKENPVKFIRLEGFTFRHAARTFMENKEPLLRSDWTTYRGGAVFFNGAEDCTVANCEFDQVGGNSIFVNNYNRRITIKGCYIHNSGANGIVFVGDPEMVRSPLFRYGDQDFEKIDRTPGPKGDNFPKDCVVEDCLITMTGRDEKQTSPIQISMSHMIRVSHCSIYDVPRAGINISEGTFGGHIIEHCDVFNTVLETGDHGSFNSWGRDRFWTPDVGETTEEVKKDPYLPYLDILEPNIIRNSRWRCDYGWDIDLDDGSTWYRIYNNVLLNGGLKMREGYDRKATNNVIINNSLHPHVWYVNSGDVFKHNIVYGAYRPARMQWDIPPDGKWGAELDSNLFATSEADRLKFAQNSTDAHSLVGDPLFVDPGNGDYRVKENSPALLIGFENFPMDEFGVVSGWLKKIAKHPDIPGLMQSKKDYEDEAFTWHGASVKNIETREQQSAFGLSENSGVMILSTSENALLSKLRVGDVILKYNGKKVDNFFSLQKFEKENWQKQSVELIIQRNQSQKKIILIP